MGMLLPLPLGRTPPAMMRWHIAMLERVMKSGICSEYDDFRASAGLPPVGGRGCILVEVHDLKARVAGFDADFAAWRVVQAEEDASNAERRRRRDEVEARSLAACRAKAKKRSAERRDAKARGDDWAALMRERNRSMLADRELLGMTFAALGKKYDVSPGRAQDIISREIRIERRRASLHRAVPSRSRPIDMGGTRDVWHEWTPEMQAAEFGKSDSMG
jgi:hypothetical protein